MKLKQCGNCEFWDRENIRLLATKSLDQVIADCLSLDNKADSYTETGLGSNPLEKYPMLLIEGNDCLVYEDRQNG